MIHIRCTENEKRQVINVIVNNRDECLFSEVDMTVLKGCFHDCWKCLEQNIEWEVTEND